MSGAGISAESGLKTFRDAGGLWEGHRIEDVASPEAFRRNPALVQNFYNQRREQLKTVVPNDAHKIITELEQFFNVSIITQNVDNLHERAGSSSVIHLHGELVWACSSLNRKIRQYIGYREIAQGELADDGSLLRPDIVWFGEEVEKMNIAIQTVILADILVVIGTSLEVYPAASLIHYAQPNVPVYIIDPNRHSGMNSKNITVIQSTATHGMRELYRILVPEEND